MNTIFGTKQRQSQLFLTDGTRIPVTLLHIPSLPVIQVKTKEKDGYLAFQVGLGVGKKKQMSRAFAGHISKAKLTILPKQVVEIRVNDTTDMPEVGSLITAQDVLKPGDIVKVSGISKGKGFAGGVKRHGFHGGPRTHGQSDRERAPGSLGQGTTPGRVYKGKKMAGHMGVSSVSITNLVVVAVDGETVSIAGLVPGLVQSVVRIEKTGESKKFVPPLSALEARTEVAKEATTDEAKEPGETEKTKEASSEIGEKKEEQNGEE